MKGGTQELSTQEGNKISVYKKMVCEKGLTLKFNTEGYK